MKEKAPKEDILINSKYKFLSEHVILIKNQTPVDRKGFAVLSLVLGIISIVLACFWFISIPCGIIAVILGVMSKKSTKPNVSLSGLVTGSIGVFISIIIIIVFFAVSAGLINGLNKYAYGEDYYSSYNS